MHPSKLFASILVSAVLLVAPQASAGVIATQTVSGFANGSSNPPPAFSITLSGLATDSLAGGTLNLETFGDFANSTTHGDEYIDISIDGFSFGRIWDRNTSNDNFVGTTVNNDFGQQYGDNINGIGNASADLFLSESVLDGFLADGNVVIGFSFGDAVGNFTSNTDEFITATLTYDEQLTNPVPEPTTMAIFGVALFSVGCSRRRRARAA